jgi:hypothetical protein
MRGVALRAKRDLAVVLMDKEALQRKAIASPDGKAVQKLEAALRSAQEREGVLSGTVASLSAQLAASRSEGVDVAAARDAALRRAESLAHRQRRLAVCLALRIASLKQAIEHAQASRVGTAVDADRDKHALRAKLSAERRANESLTADLARAQAELAALRK